METQCQERNVESKEVNTVIETLEKETQTENPQRRDQQTCAQAMSSKEIEIQVNCDFF